MPRNAPPPNIDRQTIAETYARIRPHIRTTPLIRVDAADFDLAGPPLVLKLECLQHTGSFKARGAFASLLLRDVPSAGVAAASGGNHGAAVAFAARKLGTPAHIFVPAVSSPAKIARIRSYGAALVVKGEAYADALAECEAFIANSGALSVHAYDQPETLLGQGTVGLELQEQASDFDTLLVAVGGGGLVGGIAAWFEGRKRIVAVEPEGAPTYAEARTAGRPVDVAVSGLAADSLGARRIGSLMYPIASRYVAASVLVTDAAIRQAQQQLWDVVRLAVEPGGAAALAALTSGAYQPCDGERVAVLVCGANTTAVSFD